jgi:DNA-binding transcriptional MerR regulator
MKSIGRPQTYQANSRGLVLHGRDQLGRTGRIQEAASCIDEPIVFQMMGSERQPKGLYLAHEVGRLAGVSGDRVGQWARRGYIRSSQSEGRPRIYSYQDVAEAMVVHELDARRFDLRYIRATIDNLRSDYGEWPLQTARLFAENSDRVLARPQPR